MAVPLFDIQRQHQPLREEFRAALDRVLTSGAFILGGEVSAFEEDVARYIGVDHAIGVSSGTDALLVALMALGLEPGDEVLCPAFTFFATAGSIVRSGATPVWVDVDPVSYNMDLEDAGRKVSTRTRAVMPAHLFGQTLDMEKLVEFCRTHHLLCIEDAAQAIGARFDGRMAGDWGDIGAFSFYPTKNLGGMGDSGLMTTGDADLAERIRRLRNHGMHPRYRHHQVGGNFRMDAMQAALLRIKLPHLDSYHRARSDHAAFYQKELKGHGLLTLPESLPRREHVWNQFTVRVGDGRRDALRTFLAERGVGTEIYYPLTLDRQPCFAGVGRGSDALENAHRLAEEVLSLPVFPELAEGERQQVVDALWKFGY